jgi:hypothetical protein
MLFNKSLYIIRSTPSGLQSKSKADTRAALRFYWVSIFSSLIFHLYGRRRLIFNKFLRRWDLLSNKNFNEIFLENFKINFRRFRNLLPLLRVIFQGHGSQQFADVINFHTCSLAINSLPCKKVFYALIMTLDVSHSFETTLFFIVWENWVWIEVSISLAWVA